MRTYDSTLAYFVNQLDNLDRKLYEPLYSVTWGRDIKLREGITMSQETTSFMRSTFGKVGSQSATGKPWLSPNSTTLPGISINGERSVTPLRLLANEISYTSVELERSQFLGQPIDKQRFDSFNIAYQMYTDEMVYIGDKEVGATGLLNSNLVISGSVNNGAAGYSTWANKTPDEIIKDIEKLIKDTWTASGYAVCPDKLLLPPTHFSYIASQKVSSAGNLSILTYLEENSMSLRINGRKLDVQPLKWLSGRGAGNTDRMVTYTNDENQVRFPMVPIRRETPYYLGIRFVSPYIWAYGEVEFVRPETVQYADGI